MLKKVILGVGFLALTAAAAEAKTYTVEVTPNNDKCYIVNYVPATYLVNTRGKLVKGERRVWVGEIADGNTIYHRRVPATYLETRTLVEADHYSLSPC
jgi:hypothetical protein